MCMRPADDKADSSAMSDGEESVTGGLGASLAPVTVSIINFVDLAGSERLSQVATDDVDKEKIRQKEVCHAERIWHCVCL